MKQILMIAFTLLLSACATQTVTSPPLVDQTSLLQSNEQINRLIGLQKEECMKSEYSLLRQKSPCSSKDITFAELTDSTKMTNAQKVLFMKAVAVLDSYSKQITDIYRQLGTPEGDKIANARDWQQAQTVGNRIDLIERKITWGVYLRNRQQQDVEMLRRASN